MVEPVIYGAIAGGATLAGIALLKAMGSRALRYSHYLNSAAAGFILAVAFFHLMPEAYEAADDAMLFVGLGFAVFYLLEVVLVVHSGVEVHFHGQERDQGGHEKALVAFTGLLFHSLLDGIVIGVAFQAEDLHGHAHIGLLTAFSVILHELPEGVTTYSLLIRSMSARAATWMSGGVAVATPVGVVLAMALLPGTDEHTLGRLLAVAAGSFLYVGASDLIPETHGRNGIRNAVCLLLGAAAIYLMGVLLHGGH